MKKKLQTTEYVNQKWEKQGNSSILDENWWLVEFCMEMHKFSRMAGIWLKGLHFITPKQKAQIVDGDINFYRQYGFQPTTDTFSTNPQ